MPDTITLTQLRRATRALASPERAALNRRYFKCGPGEYGEGDQFLGLTLPAIRGLVRTCRHLSLVDLGRLLDSRWHEERLLALIVLVQRFKRGTPAERTRIGRLYLRKRRRVNNWDLVDCSAPTIVGGITEDRDRILKKLVGSPSVWDRRIAVLAAFDDVRKGEFAVPLRIARQVLADRHDLIHKALGWMLREIGKRDRAAEEAFLRAHAHEMPRTALRYAIERFPEPLRRQYLAIKRQPAPGSRRTRPVPRDS